MLEYTTLIAISMITLALILNIYRLIVGPGVIDRVLALDTCYINSIALIILIGIHFKNHFYFEAALLVALMGFVGTVATSRYLSLGNIIK